MKNMLDMIIELEPDSEDCYRGVIPGHSQNIARIITKYNRYKYHVNAETLKNIATELFKVGLAKDFIIEVWQKRYYGNIGLGRALTLSYAWGRCITTDCHGLATNLSRSRIIG